MHLRIWRLSPGSSSRALADGVAIQVFRKLPRRPGLPRQALTACLAMTNQYLVSFMNCLTLKVLENGGKRQRRTSTRDSSGVTQRRFPVRVKMVDRPVSMANRNLTPCTDGAGQVIFGLRYAGGKRHPLGQESRNGR